VSRRPADDREAAPAAEGLIGVALAPAKGVLVEVNSETDFVPRNDHFQGLVKMIAQAALKAGPSVDAILAAHAGSATIGDAITSAIATIGENMSLRRAAVLAAKQGAVASYIHNQVSDGLGKIGVLVALESSDKTDELLALGRKLAMHVAAANPQALDAAGLDPAVINREREVLAEKFKALGQARERDREDRRVRPQDVLQGGVPARSGLCARAQQERRADDQGSRRRRRRPDPHRRLRALRAGRENREAGIRFRGRPALNLVFQVRFESASGTNGSARMYSVAVEG
jgi:translation elongation factor Ts